MYLMPKICQQVQEMALDLQGMSTESDQLLFNPWLPSHQLTWRTAFLLTTAACELLTLPRTESRTRRRAAEKVSLLLLLNSPKLLVVVLLRSPKLMLLTLLTPSWTRSSMFPLLLPIPSCMTSLPTPTLLRNPRLHFCPKTEWSKILNTQSLTVCHSSLA